MAEPSDFKREKVNKENMAIVFTKHAENKFEMLRRHKFVIEKRQILEAVMNPDKIDYSRLPLVIVQRPFDSGHVLRVVYKQDGDKLKIITFYPGRKSQYEEN